MNTSKQVNIMIGVVLLSILLFGGYMLNEGKRQADAREERTEAIATRGARLFVNNCRTCHGLDGEGAVGPPLHTNAFLILNKDNKYGLEATPAGEADSIRSYLHNTIACGRNGTFMPTWSDQYGGPLSDTQINQIVTMITEGRWDLVEEIGAELDAETGRTAKDILPSDPSSLAVTDKNCGQFTEEDKEEVRSRDPFSTATPTPTPSGSVTPGATATATTGTGGGGGNGIGVTLSEFKVTPASTSTAAGDVTFNVSNQGAVAHELVVIKTDLAADALPQKTGAVDEAAVNVAKKTANIASKKSENLSVTLTPGKYVLICNVPGHYQAGMHAEFTVQ
jgi:uncharacterized cupredoxin-like copper-binding protein/mono/diheme cytochrome c family protein